MPSHVVTDKQHVEINNSDYLYKCTKCGEIKPNYEYSKDANQAKGRGRGYVTSCKKCRNEYGKTDSVKERKRITAPLLRKKNRISVIYWSSVINSRKRNIEHSITKSDIIDLYNKQDGLCFYTGKPILINTIDEPDSNNSVSIDRVDSSKGYIKDNVVLCRWIVNRMKNDINFSDFLQLVSEIHKNFNL